MPEIQKDLDAPEFAAGTVDAAEIEDSDEVLDLIEIDEKEGSLKANQDNPEAVSYSSPATNSFKASVFPVLVIDRQLMIIYANPACEKLFTGFSRLTGHYFIDVFGKFFDVADIRKIRETIIKGENGYSWKGETRIKSRDMVTVQTRVYIFPVEQDAKQPVEFEVLFDDVTEESKELLRAVFLSLLEASRLKDNDTGKHITRVGFYSRLLAKELYYSLGRQYPAIDADFIENISFLASMHDVGKIGTPDDILNKQGPLSEWEWNIMREHSKNGAFILSTYPNPMAKEIALSHHEHWDGGGYPFHIEGEKIPISARIVSIADAYDALRMVRSYKKALSHEATVARMMEAKGTHFDPVLIEVFHIIASDFNDIYEKNCD